MRLRTTQMIRVFLISSLILLTFFSKAQVTADFSLSETEGCVPMHIVFSNNSTGSNLSYSWDFGNGNTSTLESPEANYCDAGVYNISLTVTDGASTDVVTKTLTVYANPIANFTPTSYTGCVGDELTFQDISTTQGADIVDWIWDLRDGSYPPHAATINHTYNAADVYGISLEVVDENGCRGFIEHLDIIDISARPTFYYTASETNACTTPLTVNFEAVLQSTTNPPYTYEWDLGDGVSAGQNTASKTYNSFGYYDCSLKVTNGNGCSHTVHSPNVNIAEIESVFDIIVGSDTLQDGDTICPGMMVDFVDNSTGGSMISWANGSASLGTGSELNEVFYQSGVYNITHTVNGSGCSDSGTLTFYVDEINADFGPDYDTICSPYTNLQFTDASTNAVSWLWIWGDGDSSFVQNPEHAFNITNPVNDYEGHNHYYTLFATSPFGCTDAHTEWFYVNMPFAEFVSDVEEGMSPLTVEFYNFSEPLNQITDYTWLHNGVAFSNSFQPQLTIVDTGLHEIQLVVTNDEGCTDTSIVREIRIGDIINGSGSGLGDLPPDSMITCDCSGGTCYPGGAPPTFCASETFTLTIFDNNPVNMYQFDGEGLSHLCSNSNSGDFNISGVIGETEVSGTIINYGVMTQLPSISIILEGPSVSFDYAYDCDSALKYNFMSTMLDATSFIWDFGDGATDDMNPNPTHQYDTSGNYTVQLTAYNDVTGCSYQYSEVVVVRDLKADFFIEEELCVGGYLPEITLSEHEHSPVDKPYLWFKDDLPFGYYEDSTFVFNITEGYQEFKLVVRDTNFCTDTVVRTVTGLQPHAYFSAENISGCPPLQTVLTDTSHFQYGFMNRDWYISGVNVSSDSVLSHTFNNVGHYTVQLVVIDSLGCSDTLIRNNLITVANPNALIYADDNTICEGETVNFSTNYNSADSAIWYIDSVQYAMTGNYNVSYTFSEAGNYNVALVIWESNCLDSSIYAPQVKVQEAFADYSVSDTISDCYPIDITFDFLGSYPNHVGSWSWDFGDDGAGSVFSDTVRYNYGHPGTYMTTLNTVTTYGCEASQQLEITVNGPLGNLLVDPGIICHGESVNFEVLDLEDVGAFVLDYGDGNTSQEMISTHTYQNEFSGEIHPTLILFSDANDPNLCKVDISRDLIVHRIKADFKVNDLALSEDTLISCHPFEAHIENTSDLANNYEWNITSGTYATSPDVYEVFENLSHYDPQYYTINLKAIYMPYGCFADTSMQITVLPIPNIELMNDSSICQGDSIQLLTSGNTNALLSWEPEILDEADNIWAPYVAPEQENIYIANVNLDNCLNSDTIEIKVQDVLGVEWSMDTTVIIGQSASIYAIPDQPNSIPTWTPDYAISCDTCIQLVATPLETTRYTFEVTDSLGCNTYREEILIEVDEKYSVNLPTSFTPNDDGVNDIVYVRGWGIEELLEFRIFNRWGDEIFFTNDITQGWDGTYRGAAQNIDSYAYMVKAKMYSGQEISKTGNITLLK